MLAPPHPDLRYRWLQAANSRPYARARACIARTHSSHMLRRTRSGPLPMPQCTHTHSHSFTHCAAQPGPAARTAEVKRREARRQSTSQRLHTRSADSVGCKPHAADPRHEPPPRIARTRTCCAAPGPNPAAHGAMHACNNSPTHSAVQPSPAARTVEVKRLQTRRQCARQRRHTHITDSVGCKPHAADPPHEASDQRPCRLMQKPPNRGEREAAGGAGEQHLPDRSCAGRTQEAREPAPPRPHLRYGSLRGPRPPASHGRLRSQRFWATTDGWHRELEHAGYGPRLQGGGPQSVALCMERSAPKVRRANC
jgi:hypothetical protein